MKVFSLILVGFVALQHVLFLIIEMFLWNTSVGTQIFGLSPEFASTTTALAANQGLYNGFLAAGLLLSLFNKKHAFVLQVFILSCVIIAGIFGGITAKPSIIFVQALPALLALVIVIISSKKSKT